MIKEAISKRTLKPLYTFMTSMGLKEGVQNSKKHELNMKWSQAFYEVNIFINIICHSMFVEAMKATNEEKKYTNHQPVMQCAKVYLTMHGIIPKI